MPHSPHEEVSAASPSHNSQGNLKAMALTALGIVFGDIGTSPLYALQTVLGISGGTPNAESVLGLLSLIVWTLIITVSVKYVTFVMRADNGGEGGILALMSLLRMKRHHRPLVIALGLFGASLIYGDGAITPAISVLSAVEGLKVAAPSIAHFALPISIFILLTLFAVQYHGTARIGWVFGPIMGVWFVLLAAMGISGILQNPSVLTALNPWHGVHYLISSGSKGFLVLGGVFLTVTGAEALYADMGHIGAKPIRLAWYALVLPSLILNYAGQSALLLAPDATSENIFFQLCPSIMLLPLTILATMATIIASQAIITGAFSMTRQAILLGWCPRLNITQTSSEGYGQIYIGAVNWILMIITVALTLAFGSSDRLASAYGIAVSLTMLLTTILLYVTMREVWQWGRVRSIAVAGAFICIDAVFFSANLIKVLEGGWVPLVLAICTYIVLWTWRRGSVAVAKELHNLTIPLEGFMTFIRNKQIPRVPGTAIFLSKTTEQTPPLMIWHVAHNKSLHEHLVALSVVIQPVPWIAPEERMRVEKLAPEFWRMVAHYGFMERPDIPALLREGTERGCKLDLSDVTYYIGHETILHCPDGTGLPQWQEELFALLRRNAAQIHEYLKLPHESVVEIGRQLEI